MSTCTVPDCEARSFGRGLCGRHYQRLIATGQVELSGRPEDWGQRKKHPLYQRWVNLKRRSGGVAPEWESFECFVADVGDYPDGHSLCPERADEPMGPANFRWMLLGKGMPRPRLKGQLCKAKGCKSPPHALDLCHKHHARWLRKGTLDDPEPKSKMSEEQLEAMKRRQRLRKYGLSHERYLELVEFQGGVCAICGGVNENGKPLFVDHCHTTGSNRQLLCHHCNAGIGMFKDSPRLLIEAAKYLNRNLEKGAA